MLSDNLRILHLIDSEGIYGAEIVLLNLLPALKKNDINVTLGCLSPIDSEGTELGKKLEKNSSIPVIFINEDKKISLQGLIAIYLAIKKIKANILHVHGYKATILGGLIAIMARIPLMATYHGEAKRTPELSTYVKIETYFLRKARKIISVSSRIKEELISRGISGNKISVIYNGIEDPTYGKPEKKHIKNSTDFSPHLLCIGRLIHIKRYDIVIDAVNVLRNEFPGIGLSIAGTGPMDKKLKNKVTKLGLNSSVRFLGYVNNIKELYQNADIFVLSSETEGSPVVLIEAMAFSLPIVATSVGAIPEMIKHGVEALIIPPGNLPDLIESLRYLISRPETRCALGGAARRTFIAKFSSSVMARAYFHQYEAMLE